VADENDATEEVTSVDESRPGARPTLSKHFAASPPTKGAGGGHQNVVSVEDLIEPEPQLAVTAVAPLREDE
jgi:hypothetical protein